MSLTLCRAAVLLVVFPAVATAQAGPELFRSGGTAFNQGFGHDFTTCDDLDADGVRDLVIAARPGSTPAVGLVRIVSAATGAVLRDWNLGPFVDAVADAGDVDADGVGDIVVLGSAESSVGFTRTATVWVLSGATGAQLHAITTRQGYDVGAVAGLGDVDGDGHADFAYSAEYRPFFPPYVAEFAVISGRDGNTLYGQDRSAYAPPLGSCMAAIPDANGDGIDDLALCIGTALELRSGATGQVLRSWPGEDGPIASAGDVDGDGRGDLVVGEPSSPAHNGLARVLSGGTGAVLQEWAGYDPFERFGSSVGGAGDVDGDGFDDVIVGSSTSSTPTGRNTSFAYIFSGGSGRLLQWFTQAGRLGAAVGGVGDVDGDGTPDLAASAPSLSSSAAGLAGTVFVWSGVRQGLLFDLVDLRAGQTAALRLEGCDPSSVAAYVLSLTGPGPVPTVWGPLHAGPPVFILGVAVCDVLGRAELSLPLPGALAGSGTLMFLQAAEATAGRNVILSHPRWGRLL
ncbi:MAG: hypothetical protein AAF628_11235 [Planctomycetota bacterium]